MSTDMNDVLTPAQDVSEQPQERMLTQTQVDDIVKREKVRAAEKARMEAEARLSGGQSGQQQMQGQPDMGMDRETLRKQVLEDVFAEADRMREEAEREQLLRELQDTADQYHHKVKKGSELFDDYNEVMADFEPAAFPALVRLAAPLDNLSEIMYELTKNPGKLVEINDLAQKSPKLAQRQLEKLSESIGKNLAAKANNVSAPAPLSKIKPSSVGADNGKMNLRDLKKQDWLRG